MPIPTIRPARREDLDEIVRLEEVTMPDPWGPALVIGELVLPAALILVVTRPRDRDRPDLNRGLAGYVFFRRGPAEAELLRLGVEPESRGRGFGFAVVRAGLEILEGEGMELCFLEVREGNAPALALYARLGFEETGRRRGYYPDGADALLLTRRPGSALPSDESAV